MLNILRSSFPSIRSFNRYQCVRSLSSKTTMNPVQFDPSNLSEDLARRVAERDEAFRLAYDKPPTSYPEHAHPPGRTIDNVEALRKKLLYRSKQRGWLEVDLLMGSWAEQYIHELNYEELQIYNRLLNQETIDIFHIVTGMKEVPPELESPLMDRIKDYADTSPLGKASIKAYEAMKKRLSN